MKELNKKYLTRMLEGVEQNLTQIDAAFEQAEGHLLQMREQREEMVTAKAEIRSLLGMPEEKPDLKLVPEENDNVGQDEQK